MALPLPFSAFLFRYETRGRAVLDDAVRHLLASVAGRVRERELGLSPPRLTGAIRAFGRA